MDGYERTKWLSPGVYLARASGRKVAVVKQYFLEEENFAREIAALEAIALGGGHKNVMSHLAIGDEEILFPYVKGETLMHRPDDPETCHDVFVGVCHGVQYLHDQGIVHNDIKPANILLSQSGPIVFDYDCSQTPAHPSRLYVTPPFAAPEDTDNSQMDTRVDVFSLGATFHWVICGEFLDRRNKPYRINAAVPKKFTPVIQKAISVNADDRHQCVDEMIEELEKI